MSEALFGTDEKFGVKLMFYCAGSGDYITTFEYTYMSEALGYLEGLDDSTVSAYKIILSRNGMEREYTRDHS